MKTRIQALEMSTFSKPTQSADFPCSSKGPSRTQTVAVHNISKAKPRTCSHCQADHYISSCGKFRALPIDSRTSFVLEKKLCLNCLGVHQRKDCRSTGTCITCRGRHHSLLHRTSDFRSSSAMHPQLPPSQRYTTPAESATPSEQVLPRNAVNTFTIKVAPPQSGSILLATAKLTASSAHGRNCVVRALIDPCSEASFVAEALAQRLRLPRQSVFVPITGVGAAPSYTAKGQVNLTISPLLEDCDSWKITALVLPRLTDYLPSPQLITSADFIDGLCLADPEPNSVHPIEMIIGADVFPTILREGLRKSADGRTIAQATGLGWILTGSNPSETADSNRTRPIASLQCLIDMELSSQLERFWTQEEVLSQTPLPLTADEAECEHHFATTHRRTSEGRYVLRLPFNSKLNCLGNSAISAQKALLHSEKRFKHEPEFREKYTKFMDDYISLEHMELATSVSNPPSFLLPHHGVFKVNGDTTKLRVVFNGSVKLRDGLAINDCLHVGPKLQADLFDILLRWRKSRYVFSADIEKMFRQIQIDPEDRAFQRILWRPLEDQPIQIYDLCTVTYGLASSPYQAIRTLQQLASDEGDRFPRAAQLIRRDCYVDDIFAGADTVEDAHQLKAELIELLLAGGFPLSKWTANHPSLLNDLPQHHQATSSTWQQTDAFQMLGVTWKPLLDAFSFQFNHLADSNKQTTKRTALSLIAQLYDPIGWISPVTVSLKIFMQSLWHAGVSWDDALPQNLQLRWNSLTKQLPQLESFSVPRWIGTSNTLRFAELHGFSDASERAYAACLYLRSVDHYGRVQSILLTSKTKVAPLKQVSLPRLELCGALVCVRLVSRIRECLSLNEVACHLWSDSTITLSWIREHPTAWKTYVANRVSEIQTTLPQASWHHIKGTINPADLASRGVSASELVNSTLWMQGPPFLTANDAQTPRDDKYEISTNCPDRRSMPCLVVTNPTPEFDLLTKYSSITKLLRVTARCLEFIERVRRSKKLEKEEDSTEKFQLTPIQLQKAQNFWISYVQTRHFASEINCLKRSVDFA